MHVAVCMIGSGKQELVKNLKCDEIIIYNLNGQIVSKKQVHAKQTTLDVSGFTKGIYILKVISEGHVKTVKIIKK